MSGLVVHSLLCECHRVLSNTHTHLSSKRVLEKLLKHLGKQARKQVSAGLGFAVISKKMLKAQETRYHPRRREHHTLLTLFVQKHKAVSTEPSSVAGVDHVSTGRGRSRKM